MRREGKEMDAYATVVGIEIITLHCSLMIILSVAAVAVSGGGRWGRGIRPRRHFEGRKYGILKIGRFWQIDVCIAERFGS